MLPMSRRILNASVVVAAMVSAPSHATHAQALPVARGRIQRPASNGSWSPASGLLVTLRSERGIRSMPVYTGNDGMYYFKRVPPGRYLLEVWYAGARAPFVNQWVVVQYVPTPTGPLCDIPPINLPRG